MSQPWKKKIISAEGINPIRNLTWFLVEITVMTVKTLCGEEAVYACFQ